ncbi:hypothetical protein CXB51_002873 [Gossypium anomalum]|uniref:RNase H type-1 domain-containing protein n=1 Tax=Gossypium anomalum TaxID=47600 RepID=A0A8J5ZFR9_9ROSI|nr:hypothetical protein CXB51_002873 [Gossypium anomalum]
MQHRQLVSNTNCPRCDESAETIDHIFRECPITVEVWTLLKIQNLILVPNMDFLQWITWIFDLFSSQLRHLFCCGLLETRRSIKGKETRKWSDPPREFVKINFDGAYNETHHKSASGVVVKNEEGLVLLSCSEIHHGVSSAFAAEAIACRKAVQVGVEHQWPKVIIEGDSLTIIKKCRNKSQDRSHIGAYIHDIQQNINRYRSFFFKHTLRSANNLAHVIATETLRREEEMYLEMGVPVYAEIQQRMDRRRESD